MVKKKQIFSGGVPKNLDELFIHGRDFAKHCFDQTGEVLPMWILQDTNGNLVPVGGPLSAGKQVILETVKSLIASTSAVRMVFIGESWMVTAKSKSEAERISRDLAEMRVSEHPEKVEVIYIAAEDKYHHKSGFFEIKRKDGKAELSPFQTQKTSEIGGDFSNLLADSPTIQ